MSLLDIGARCHACALVDFLPFSCPGCSKVFCREHVQTHDCPTPAAARPEWRKRLRGICAYGGCDEETIESIGGLEGSADDVAREVRCTCGNAYCVKHRSQEAHECGAPRALHARQVAAAVRREKAAEVLARHFPGHTKERLGIPKQVDRTRTGSPPRSEQSGAAPTVAAPPPPRESPVPPATLTADDKLYKLHQIKTRSLARPLDPKVPREESAAIEFVVDEGGTRLRTWLAGEGKYAPTSVGQAMVTGKPERVWVPHVMPGGKLFDTLVARTKMSRTGMPITVLIVSPRPGSRTATALDLTCPAGPQIVTGDILVVVRGWE
ncbi:hypothetical protein CC85DRAFT_331550 [Cutaneotrichosporon oleaginosum]|uniref:AN1-type domain-containing protein n=1 Tax=Cutaneotrichosporon oleaginosum TaxID=879819 RepID=A0A0J0XBR4_9TREE|nr:uncharacterized protein CC85DRAFT_331550 [Cutaneotrichosporon oleaginosum]KLT38510.1 hypothetical protein CC85DRAFT_331550 [Cutaneotrichosporon oleaginosum]TXT12298.1 hypothetical protein COLE_02708 [Cutaneotrichosporon oleaginosum]